MSGFIKASLVGAFAPLSVWTVYVFIAGGDWSEAWSLPVLIIAYGVLQLPFVALGLAIFGLPARIILRRVELSPLVAPVAFLWGAVAGKLAFAALKRAMGFGYAPIASLSFADPGIWIGGTTGLAYWWVEHREARVASTPDAPSGQ